MGRPPNPKTLEDTIERAVKEQLTKTTPGSKDRQEALMTAIRFIAVKAKIQMPDEGRGFDDDEVKGETA
jgi:hypothetical protein